MTQGQGSLAKGESFLTNPQQQPAPGTAPLGSGGALAPDSAKDAQEPIADQGAAWAAVPNTAGGVLCQAKTAVAGEHLQASALPPRCHLWVWGPPISLPPPSPLLCCICASSLADTPPPGDLQGSRQLAGFLKAASLSAPLPGHTASSCINVSLLLKTSGN